MGRSQDVVPLREATRAWVAISLSTWNPTAFALTVLALMLIFKVGWSTLRTLGICAALGLLAHLALQQLPRTARPGTQGTWAGQRAPGGSWRPASLRPMLNRSED